MSEEALRRLARTLRGLRGDESVRAFCERHGFSAGAWRHWEYAQWGPNDENRARLLERFGEGVFA